MIAGTFAFAHGTPIAMPLTSTKMSLVCGAPAAMALSICSCGGGSWYSASTRSRLSFSKKVVWPSTATVYSDAFAAATTSASAAAVTFPAVAQGAGQPPTYLNANDAALASVSRPFFAVTVALDLPTSAPQQLGGLGCAKATRRGDAERSSQLCSPR